MAGCLPSPKTASHTTDWSDEGWKNKGHTTAIVSQTSFSNVYAVAKCLYGPKLKPEFNNLKRALDGVKPRDVAFNIAIPGVNQSDCAVYSVNTDGKIDYKNPLEYLGLVRDGIPECRDLFRRIGQSINIVAEALSWAGFENVFWTTYPDPLVRDGLLRHSIDKISLFSLVYGVDSVEYLVREDFAKTIEYPVIISESESENLVDASEKFTGSKDNWVELWLLNRKSVTDPWNIKSDEKIVIPAKIEEWKEVKFDNETTATIIAKYEYGAPDFEDLIEFICSTQSSRKFVDQEGRCQIPMYEEVQGFRSVLVSKLPMD